MAVSSGPPDCDARVRPTEPPGIPRAKIAVTPGSLVARRHPLRARSRCCARGIRSDREARWFWRAEKRALPAIPKNLGNGLLLAGLDAGIQIHKIPVQPPGKFLSHAALAGSHESHEKHRARCHGAPSSKVLGLRSQVSGKPRPS